MFFWIREMLGWGLVLVALVMIWIGMRWIMDLDSPRIFESAVVLMASLGVMRGGILMIRISTAARVCRIEERRKS
ncbi:MAG: hypothetical protein U0905_11175 [Pirellulales bacterium]